MCLMDPHVEDTPAEKELRQWLAKRLKRNDVPPPLWEWLKADSSIEDVLSSDQNFGREDLLSIIQERLHHVKAIAPFVGTTAVGAIGMHAYESSSAQRNNRRTLGRTPVFDPLLDPLAEAAEDAVVQTVKAGVPLENVIDPSRIPLLLDLIEKRRAYREAQATIKDDPVTRRAEAFSLYLAKLADEDSEVKRFREAVWEDGRPLSKAEAENVIYSPATAIFPSTWFKEWDVPIVRHTARITELKRISSNSPLRFKGEIELRYDEILEDDFIQLAIAIFDGVAMASDPFEREVIGSERMRALHGSVVSELLRVSDYLSTRFPWRPLEMDVFQILKFILTGKPPWVEPIRVSLPQGYTNVYETVNISVWPWVPVEEVASLYDRARKELDPTPTTSPRRLALFMFVMRDPKVKLPSEGDKPTVVSWRELQRLWNEQHPSGDKWNYSDVRNFRRDFNRAFDQIVNLYRNDQQFPQETGGEEWFEW